MRIAGRGQGRAYTAVSRLFLAQFFLFRRVGGRPRAAARHCTTCSGVGPSACHCGLQAVGSCPAQAPHASTLLLLVLPPPPPPVCRVVISNAYFFKLLATVLGLEQQPWWAWAGVAVFGLLNTLNAVWLVKLVAMARRGDRKQQLADTAAADAGKGSPGAAAAAAAPKGASGGAAMLHSISVTAYASAGLMHKSD